MIDQVARRGREWQTGGGGREKRQLLAVRLFASRVEQAGWAC